MSSLQHIIDLILKLINKCNELAVMRITRKQSFLSDHVDPLMRDIDKLHSAYLELFSTARDQMLKASNPRDQLQKIGNELKKASANTVSLRQSILARAEVYHEKSISDFIETIITYLRATSAWQTHNETIRKYLEQVSPRSGSGTPKVTYYALSPPPPCTEEGTLPPRNKKGSPSSNKEKTTAVHIEIDARPVNGNVRLLALNLCQALGDEFYSTKIILPDDNPESIRRDCIQQCDDLIKYVNSTYHHVQSAYQRIRKELL